MAIQKIGFIGLGTMGRPMARRLCEGGFVLRVFDINPKATAELAQAGATVCRSPAETVTGVDAICTMLPDSQHVEQALLGENGVLRGARPGALIIEMSTIEPSVTQSLAQKVVAAGLRMVDAPVCRTNEHAARGELLILIGGNQADCDEAMPVLQRMGNTFFFCGPVGSAIKLKLVNNMLAQSISLAVCEALTLGKKAGLDVNLMREVFAGTAAGNKSLEMLFTRRALQGDFRPGFSLDWSHKDTGHALRLAALLNTPCPAAAVAHTFLNIARSQGKGTWDHTALLTVFEEMAGVNICPTPFQTPTA